MPVTSDGGGRGRRRWVMPMIVVTVLIWVPLLCLAFSLGTASLIGCEINEAGTSTCLVGGIDVATPLAVMMIMGWVAIGLLPFMALSVLGWTSYGLWRLWRWLRRGSER